MKKGPLILILVFMVAFLQSYTIDKTHSEYFKKSHTSVLPQEEDIENTIQRALDELKQGKWDEAVDLLAEAILLIKSKEGFHVREITLCSRIDGFRDYSKIGGNILKKGTPLLVYIEPAGYQILKELGEFKIWLSEDAKITNGKGDVVFERNNWVDYNKSFPKPDIPFYITNRVSDIPEGIYTFSFTIKDHYKKTFLTETFEFVVK
jgi:hypothetical protein